MSCTVTIVHTGAELKWSHVGETKDRMMSAILQEQLEEAELALKTQLEMVQGKLNGLKRKATEGNVDSEVKVPKQSSGKSELQTAEVPAES